jgi:hypothetical protein
MRGRAESSGPTSSAHDQADVGPLLASQGLVWLSPDSRSWGCALDEWLPRRRRAEGDRRQARGGREAGTRWSSGWEAGAARGFSWYTDRCVAEGIAVRVLTAVDQHTCLFPANLQSPAMESFHAALQIARALCTVPPRIAAPEHAVLDFSTVGRSAHRVIRAQLAALLRDTQRHLDRRDAAGGGSNAEDEDDDDAAGAARPAPGAGAAHARANIVRPPNVDPNIDDDDDSALDQYGIALIDCSRGTNDTECVHKQIVTTFGSWNTVFTDRPSADRPFSESVRLRLARQEQCRAAR